MLNMILALYMIPVPGIEPGPSAGKAPILTIRQYWIADFIKGCYLYMFVIPIPGIEPGPSAGKAPILTVRQYRIAAYNISWNLIIWLILLTFMKRQ